MGLRGAQVVRCAMASNASTAATATEDHRVQVWELPSGRLLRELMVSPSVLWLPLPGPSTSACLRSMFLLPLKEVNKHVASVRK
jgi:hypothetical protein